MLGELLARGTAIQNSHSPGGAVPAANDTRPEATPQTLPAPPSSADAMPTSAAPPVACFQPPPPPVAVVIDKPPPPTPGAAVIDTGVLLITPAFQELRRSCQAKLSNLLLFKVTSQHVTATERNRIRKVLKRERLSARTQQASTTTLAKGAPLPADATTSAKLTVDLTD
mmetsp:Transcript_16887/g.43152  ORF Transcript_16887/g.43152 Transcript_16887/m.43152 type:complete len:169 (-) Transcript_16887:241-747(-)